jgi:hypothetical protein
MRTPLWAVAMTCCVLLAPLAAAPAAAAEPVLGDTPNEQQIQAYLAYWVNAIRDAKADAEAIAAREKIVEGYKKSDEKSAGYTYADKAAGVGADALKKGFGGDVSGRVKEINLAMALSQMGQVSIQPALEAMVESKNPAVRFYGWKGYRDVRERLLAQGQQWTEKALASARKSADTETSGTVLEQVLRMLAIEGAMPNVVSKPVWDAAQADTLSILTKNWPRWCRQVFAGDEELTDAISRAGVAAVAAHAGWVGQDKAQKTKLLQMIVDMAFCGAQSFVKAKTNGQTGDAFSVLMKECEAALNAMAGANKDFLAKPLSDTRIGQNPIWVLSWVVPNTENRGVLAWVDFLKDQGVVEPKITAPSSAPASKPATAPAK